MSDSPWFEFYPSDFLAGASCLTVDEVGVYIIILALMYEADGPIPRNDERLSRRCGCTRARFKKALSGLVEQGKISEVEGKLFNGRAQKEIKKRSEKSSKARQSADVRWNGISGKTKQKQGATDADAMRTHPASICAKDANQNQNQNHIPVGTENAVEGVDQDDLSKQLFDRGVAYLGRHGTGERQARSLIGKWRKDCNDADVFAAFTACNKEQAVDPVSWITARLKPAGSQNVVRMEDIFSNINSDGSVSE